MEIKNLQQAIANKYRKALHNTAPAAALSKADFQPLSPTEAMFVLAVDGMTGSPMSGLTEESLTANFAGRMAAQFTWAVECIGNKGGEAALWGEYSKNGQGEQSESRRGADFALVVPVSEQKVKVAIFQAKKARNNEADIGQDGSKTAPELQLVKLYETAQAIGAASCLSDDESLAWVHYVFWREITKFPTSISLAMLKPILVDPKTKLSKIDTTLGSFADLLLAVKSMEATSEDKPIVVAGWLQLDFEVAKCLLPKLSALTDVIFVDEEGRGGHFADLLTTVPENRLEVKIDPVNHQSIAAQEVGTPTTTSRQRNTM